jgi:hypothetical protein
MNNYFLFARPNFFLGMARILDFGGSLNEYNTASTPQLADFRAIQSDWKAVGDEIKVAIAEIKKELPSHGEK